MSALPEPNRAPLARPVLGLVVCQIAVTGGAAKLSTRDAIAVQERLSAGPVRYSELSPIQRRPFSLQVGPAGLSQGIDPGDTASGFRLVSKDGNWTVSLFTDALGLDCRQYPGWTAYRSHLSELVTVYAERFAPDGENRLGLRYINALTNEAAESAVYWKGRVSDSFAGVLSDAQFAPYLTGSFSRTEFTFDDGLHCATSLTLQPDQAHLGRVAALIDIDVSRGGTRLFEPAITLETADHCNTRALQVFQATLTESYLDELRASS